MQIIDPIIQKYLHGKTTEEEEQQLLLWIHQSPDNEKQLFAQKDIWDTYGFRSNQKNYNPDIELDLLNRQIAAGKSKRTIAFSRIVQIAAVVLVVFGLGWASQFISFTGKRPVQITLREISVPKGQVNQVFLADGTRIWINSETQLVIPSIFSPKDRVVKLSGEAFFEVAKDKSRPFRVEVNGQEIEVLGTSFNIRAYENSNEIETTLETGQIRLKTGSRITLLNPGDQSVFDRTNNQLSMNKVDPVDFSTWKDGRYEFQNKDLIEVFKIVERWYDVEITADQAYFKGMHFSGVIKRNKDAKHFLELLNLSIPIKYKINQDKIQVSRKIRELKNEH